MYWNMLFRLKENPDAMRDFTQSVSPRMADREGLVRAIQTWAEEHGF